MRTRSLIVLTTLVLFLIGCAAPRIRLFPSKADPLQEYTLQGEAQQKVLLIPVKGVISDSSRKGLFRTKPSMVQEIVSQLRLAEKDSQVKAVLLTINSPGGTVTASDVLYHEIAAFKKRSGAKVVAAMMDVAASGGYYISLPADFILAHPTTVTGSIGVIFLRPNVTGLMGKIGLDVQVNKSGKDKDMGSPFRPSTAEENKILQSLTDQMGRRFLNLVAAHRHLEPKTLAQISTARVYLADEALRLGLVDKIGYLSDAVAEAKKLAGLPPDAKVVVYRRIEYPDDNLYNTSTMQYEGHRPALVSLGLPQPLTNLQAGFYYLWSPALPGE